MYQRVIDDVVENCGVMFEEEGVERKLLDELAKVSAFSSPYIASFCASSFHLRKICEMRCSSHISFRESNSVCMRVLTVGPAVSQQRSRATWAARSRRVRGILGIWESALLVLPFKRAAAGCHPSAGLAPKTGIAAALHGCTNQLRITLS